MANVIDTLFDVTRAQAELHDALGAGNVFGDVGERVAAAITSTGRVTGTGRDLAGARMDFERPPNPVGLAAPGPVRTPYVQHVASLPARDQRRFQAWRDSPERLGEVKVRQLDRRFEPDTQLIDTRGGGPNTAFFPFVDFYVLIIFDLNGDVAMARELSLSEMVDHVAADVGRGGSWNYKAAIGLGMTSGIDRTADARKALRNQLATVSPKRRIR